MHVGQQLDHMQCGHVQSSCCCTEVGENHQRYREACLVVLASLPETDMLKHTFGVTREEGEEGIVEAEISRALRRETESGSVIMW